MNEEVKNLLDQLNASFAAFKALNDQRYEELKARGTADPVLNAAVDKANVEISKLSATLTQVQNNLRELENEKARFAQAMSATSDARAIEAKHAAQFFSLMRFEAGTLRDRLESVSDEEMQQYRAYKKAMNSYFRRGEAAFKESGIRDALQTGTSTQGGIWLTPDMSGRVVQLVYQTSPMRSLASSQTIGTDTLQGFNDLDEAAQGWVGEQDARNETNTPAAQYQWQITMREQYANPKVSQKQLDDSFFDVEGWLANKVGQKMARMENTAFVSGNGILRPKGFNSYVPGSVVPSASAWAGVIEQVKTGVNNDFAAAAKADIFIDCIVKLKSEYRAGASWAMNQVTLAATRKIKDGQNNYLFYPSFLNGVATPPAASSLGAFGGDPVQGKVTPSGTIFGFPVYEFTDLPDYNNTTPRAIWFANWAQAYQIIDHAVGVRTLRDPYTGKPFVSFYTTKRVGGDVINFEALKAIQFSA